MIQCSVDHLRYHSRVASSLDRSTPNSNCSKQPSRHDQPYIEEYSSIFIYFCKTQYIMWILLNYSNLGISGYIWVLGGKCWSKNIHNKDMESKDIRVHVQNMLTIMGLSNQHNWRGGTMSPSYDSLSWTSIIHNNSQITLELYGINHDFIHITLESWSGLVPFL